MNASNFGLWDIQSNTVESILAPGIGLHVDLVYPRKNLGSSDKCHIKYVTLS